MLITVLFLTFVFLWFGTFVLFDRDLASPAMLLMSGYALSIAVAFVSDFAQPFDYHWETYGVLVSGIFLFLIPAYIIKRVYASTDRPSNLFRVIVNFSHSFLWIHALLCLMLTLVSIPIYVQVLSGLGVEVSTLSAITEMRNYGIEHPEGTGSGVVLILNQFKKVFIISGYFILFLWSRNCATKRRFGDDKLLLLNCVCCSAIIITEGGRGGLVAYILAGVVLYFIFDRMLNGARFRFSIKTVAIGAGIFTVGCMGFYGMLWATGRTSGEFDIAGVWHHTSFYLGGSIPLLDNFLDTYVLGEETDIFGKETFYYALQQINRLGLWKIAPYSVHLEFRPEIYEGNVYTGLRSYINDFGYEGLIILPVLYSICANWLYYASLRNSRRQVVAVGMVIYAMLSYSIFTDFIRCFFFLSFVNLNIVITIIGLIFLRRLLLSLHWMRYQPV